MKSPKPLLAPSLLSADFSKLAEEIAAVETAGADWLHLDVMDGHFVPNLTIGPLVAEAVRPHTRLLLDCHLMVSEPEKWITPFANSGADLITVHAEATSDLKKLIGQIRATRKKAGISVNPGTPLSVIEPFLDDVDLVLIMSVNPGFGGQKFIESALPKVERLVQIRNARNYLIEVDGGINASNIGTLFRAGTDVFVAGSAVFGAKDRRQAIQELKSKWTS